MNKMGIGHLYLITKPYTLNVPQPIPRSMKWEQKPLTMGHFVQCALVKVSKTLPRSRNNLMPRRRRSWRGREGVREEGSGEKRWRERGEGERERGKGGGEEIEEEPDALERSLQSKISKSDFLADVPPAKPSISC